MNFRNLIMWGLIVLLSVGLFNLFQDPKGAKVTKKKLLFQISCKKLIMVELFQVEIQGNNIKGILSDGS